MKCKTVTSVTLGLMYNMTKVNLYKCSSYDESEVKSIIDKIIDFYDELKNIKSGTKVVIKANLVSAMAPEKSATTHPILLKALTSYLLEKNCTVVIGDSPGGVFTKPYLAAVYNATKMKETGAKLNDNFHTIKKSFPEARILKSFEYTAYLDDADLLINFSKLKTHGMMGMSASVKNLFGTIPGTLKPEYHYRFPKHEDFANMLIDLNEYFKMQINIIDAIEAMEGNGPTAGTPKFVGAILTSSNPYALDYIASKIIGISFSEVQTIKQSIERKLFIPEDIELNDNLEDYLISDFKLIKVSSLEFMSDKNNIVSRFLSTASSKIFASKPEVKKSKCIGCQKCANICPMKAITMEGGKPKIDRTKCIKCYCCQEFCPVGAMRVKSSLVMKVLHKKK